MTSFHFIHMSRAQKQKHPPIFPSTSVRGEREYRQHNHVGYLHLEIIVFLRAIIINDITLLVKANIIIYIDART